MYLLTLLIFSCAVPCAGYRDDDNVSHKRHVVGRGEDGASRAARSSDRHSDGGSTGT